MPGKRSAQFRDASAGYFRRHHSAFKFDLHGYSGIQTIQAQRHRFAVAAVVHFPYRRCGSMHGAGTRVGTVASGAYPFEIRRDLAIQRDVDGIPRKVVNFAALLDAKDGAGECFGRHQAECAVDIDQMIAIELVEFGAIFGTMLGAVPPIPVAAFGNQQLFVGQFSGAFEDTLGLIVGPPRRQQQRPRLVVLFGSDPDVEVCVDPGAGEDAW